MKKLLKRAAAVFCAAAMLVLGGCDTFTTDTDKLLSPPALTGEMQPINEALSKSVKGEYMLSYPASGDIRSAIALYDVEGDGVNEAFAFYSTKTGDTTVMHINYIKKSESGWRSVADSTIEGGGVEKVEFCDLDRDGKDEILVGWEVYGNSEKKLGVYSPVGKKLQERLMEKYTGFTCCDMDGDSKNDLFLQLLDTAESSNVASIYNFTKKGVEKTAGCLMDGKVKSAEAPVVSKLKDGRTALFIDEEKGAGSITEVLFMEGGELKNPLFDGNKGENTVTQRAISLVCADMNDDGYLEIPTAMEMPMADKTGEKSYYTNWCGFDGKTLTVKTVTVMNQADGYYLVISSKLFDNIALSRNVEKKSRTFYEYNRETARPGRKLFSVTAVNSADSESFEEKNKKAIEVLSTDETVYYAELFEAGREKMDETELKEMFRIIE